MTITVGIRLLSLCYAALAFPMYADAQIRGDRNQDREQMEQRFRRQMARTIQQRLELDDVQVESLELVVAIRRIAGDSGKLIWRFGVGWRR